MATAIKLSDVNREISRRYGSIRKAKEELGISSSALTRAEVARQLAQRTGKRAEGVIGSLEKKAERRVVESQAEAIARGKGKDLSGLTVSRRGVTVELSLRSSTPAQRSVFVDDQERGMSRRLTPFEAAGLEAFSGPMTTASGQTEYVYYSDITPVNKRTTNEDSLRSAPKGTISARDVSRGRLLREKFSEQVGTPFKEGFSLSGNSEAYRGEYGKSVAQRLSYAGGLVGSVATSGGAPARFAGSTIAKLAGQSQRLRNALRTVETLSKSQTGRFVTGSLTALYAGQTTKSVIEAEKGDRVRRLFGVGKELSSFTSFGSGLREGASELREGSRFIFRGDTTVTTATADARSASGAKTTGRLYREFRGRVTPEADVLQLTKQRATVEPVLTESGAPTGSFRVGGRASTTTELRSGRFVDQVSSEDVFRAFAAESRESVQLSVGGRSVERGVFSSQADVVSSADRFARGVRSVQVEPFVVRSKGSFVRSGDVTFRAGRLSSLSDDLASQARLRELSFDVSGRSLPSSSGGSVVSETVLRSQSSGLQQALRGRSVLPEGSRVVPITSPVVEPARPVTITTTVPTNRTVANRRFSASEARQRVVSVSVSDQARRVESVSLSGLRSARFSRVAEASSGVTGLSSLSGQSSVLRSSSAVSGALRSSQSSALSQRSVQASSSVFTPFNRPSVVSVRSPVRPFGFVPPPIPFFMPRGEGKDYRSSFSGFSSRKEYNPSVTAITLGITAERAPVSRTGLEVRPVLEKDYKSKSLFGSERLSGRKRRNKGLFDRVGGF